MLEPYQQERVNLIKEILPLFGDNFVLKGGTALSLYYGLNRYSEDIDLDAKTNNMNILSKLKNHKDFKNWNITIKKDTSTTFRVMIDYGASFALGAYPLKIEVSNRNKHNLQNKILNVQKIERVKKSSGEKKNKTMAMARKSIISPFIIFILTYFCKLLFSYTPRVLLHPAAKFFLTQLPICFKPRQLKA